MPFLAKMSIMLSRSSSGGLIAGKLDEVLPLDDLETLDQAKSLTPATLAARHDALALRAGNGGNTFRIHHV
jgi:hypothetical protein